MTIWFIYIKEISNFNSVIYMNTFLKFNVNDRFKMKIFTFIFICSNTFCTIVIHIYLHKNNWIEKEYDKYLTRSLNHEMYLQEVRKSTGFSFDDEHFESNMESKPSEWN